MGLFDDAKPAGKRPRKVEPHYRVFTLVEVDNACDHEPGCTIEAVAVGNTAHYIVKKANGTIDAMYPFSSVEAVELIEEEDSEED